ncbi:MAG: hypothetical protein LBN05_00025 [Oscillospiraceae bacterium]|jgi:hypothetical protein|nr:hypothetical protein [Oscillospiraceae bacterium]
MAKLKDSTPKKIVLILVCAVVGLALGLVITVAVQGTSGWHKWEAWQEEHVAALQEQADAYNPAVFPAGVLEGNETYRVGVDVAKLGDARFNQLRGLITHNSYKQKMPPVGSLVFGAVSLWGGAGRGEFEYTFPPLNEQLDSGVMGLELDLSYTKEEDGNARFLFCHAPLLDMNSSAIDAGTALREIRLWSKMNPKHLPILLLIEPKDATVKPFNIYGMDDEHMPDFEKLLRENLGDSLITPANFLGDYADFAALRKENDWPLLKNMLGKVVVLLHPSDVTAAYVQSDPTLRTQGMFPALNYDHPQASIVLCNDPKEALERRAELIDEKNLIVRARLDVWPEYSAERYAQSMASGAQWLSTDYPPRKDRLGKTPLYYGLTLGDEENYFLMPQQPPARGEAVAESDNTYHVATFPGGGTAEIVV